MALEVLAEARWPEAEDREVPQVPGFVLSSFSPLVAAAADRCLRRYYGDPPVLDGAGERTAMIVVSGSGDAGSADHVARMVDDGRRVGPLFFFQSVPNSIAGHVAARWGIAGPVVCLCPTGDPMTDGLAEASLLIDDGDADRALVVLVEQSAVDSGESSAVLVAEGNQQ
jgi:3-oxoacyl-(acyl-carrier-protein) synthase